MHKVLNIRELSKSTYSLQIDRGNIQFNAGQCFNIGTADSGVNREYSIYSGENDEHLEFLIKEVENGIVSPLLKSLKKGDEVRVDGAYGLFSLKHDETIENKYLFIASGTGISPFSSFVRTYPKLKYQLLHGIRYKDEQYDKKIYNDQVYIPCISRESFDGFNGRVTDYLNEMEIDKFYKCYLCGNRSMISDAYEILRQKGISGSDIITEVFF